MIKEYLRRFSVCITGLALYGLGNAFGVLADGDDDDLDRGDIGRQDQSVVIAVDHDDGAKQTGGDAPRSLMGDFLSVLPAEEANAKGISESLS